jgi:hypothetical protein
MVNANVKKPGVKTLLSNKVKFRLKKFNIKNDKGEHFIKLRLIHNKKIMMIIHY